MIDLATYLAFVAACTVLIIMPGPTVTIIIANALRHGPRAGLMNVAGTQAGLALIVVVLAAGLQAVIAFVGLMFDWIRLIGAAYLIWLGIRMWRDTGGTGLAETAHEGGSKADGAEPDMVYFRQGFFVILANPKALLFLGAFLPQFIDPAGAVLAQTVLLGITFMVLATIFDGAYAVAAGKLARGVVHRHARLVNRVGGGLLVAGGLWLASMRRAGSA